MMLSPIVVSVCGMEKGKLHRHWLQQNPVGRLKRPGLVLVLARVWKKTKKARDGSYRKSSPPPHSCRALGEGQSPNPPLNSGYQTRLPLVALLSQERIFACIYS